MQLVVFHYHLLPGGVTDVIQNSLKAVVPRMAPAPTVRLVCGRPDNADAVAANLKEAGIHADVAIVPDLDYTSPDEATEDALARAAKLEALLLADYSSDECVWWVHNHHIGKNPAFTLALCRIAETRGGQRMLLHIHDFPECARYENLNYLTRIAEESPYPLGPSVRYAVINVRDEKALISAGMDAAAVSLLVNPVPPSGSAQRRHESPLDLSRGLAVYAARRGYVFHEGRPVLLYPVRTIRRKNVLEMAAISRLAGKMNLVVTLPGLSEAERPYSDLVADAFDGGAAHGSFGIGRQEEQFGLSFEALTHNADAIVSSSVQEGFGLLFVNALRWSVPLYARDLPVLEGIRDVFEAYPAAFYDQFFVPFSAPGISSIRAYLGMRYRERLDQLGDLLPAMAREKLEHQLDGLLVAETIDFSYLPPDIQLPYLKGLDDEAFARNVRGLNRMAIESLESVLSAECPDSEAIVEQRFGYEAYSRAFQRTVASFGAPDSSTGDASRAGGAAPRVHAVQQNLVERFAELENLRLLFAPVGYHHD